MSGGVSPSGVWPPLNTTVCTLGSKIVHKAKVQNNFGAKGHGLQPHPTMILQIRPCLT